MTRQNLREREIAIALSELSGKLSIREIRDHLKGKGLVCATDDVIDAWELEQTRKLIQKARKYEHPGGSGTVELVNLYEIDHEGDKRTYYRPLAELTPSEGAQLCTYWHRKGRYADRQLTYYAGVLKKMHGRKFQRLIQFELPKTPRKASTI